MSLGHGGVIVPSFPNDRFGSRFNGADSSNVGNKATSSSAGTGKENGTSGPSAPSSVGKDVDLRDLLGREFTLADVVPQFGKAKADHTAGPSVGEVKLDGVDPSAFF